ncbi:hypothetical protein [Streptomyces cacaoi]|uniref:hypothetical protein n=1 Tax=Streptomyces cacaoi TaxID=1898 RepID=UPI0011F3E8AA|nr:hypothetical protein [Streptomyces cacaoi]
MRPDRTTDHETTLATAVNDALLERLLASPEQPPTSWRDETPTPRYGDTPPVAQPGRPPMSQRATDASGVILAGGIAALPIGGALSLVLYTAGQADPTSLAVAGGTPVALVLAVSWLLRSAGRARRDAHTEHHHHYTGPVHQDHRTSSTRGVWARTNNH